MYRLDETKVFAFSPLIVFRCRTDYPKTTNKTPTLFGSIYTNNDNRILYTFKSNVHVAPADKLP